jgi:predicted RecA/RadA family phage recombinase
LPEGNNIEEVATTQLKEGNVMYIGDFVATQHRNVTSTM